MLPLYGIAALSRGFESRRRWRVFRLRTPDGTPFHSADVAIIRAAGEEASASALGFTAAVVLGADLDVDADAFRDLLVLPKQFAYLADGDVLGVTAKTGRFRTLCEFQITIDFVRSDTDKKTSFKAHQSNKRLSTASNA
jgi:hypothetical protein